MKRNSGAKTSAVTMENVQDNPSVLMFMEKGNSNLGTIGYTEHGERHAKIVSKWARTILEELGYDRRSCELAAIGGFLHDIGNSVNRRTHGQSGAMLAYNMLREMGMTSPTPTAPASATSRR
jgi:metal-dependent HD superfamily phosphatase/phosphodiesterase